MQWSLNGVSELGWIHLIRGVPGRQLCLPRSSFGRRRPVDGRDKSRPTVVVPLTAWPCGLGVGCVGGDSSQQEIRRKNQRTLLSLRCLVGHGNALSTVTFGDESCWLGVVGDRLTKTDRRTLFTRSAKEPVSRHSWTAELDYMHSQHKVWVRFPPVTLALYGGCSVTAARNKSDTLFVQLLFLSRRVDLPDNMCVPGDCCRAGA
jgi:hypothetical protein